MCELFGVSSQNEIYLNDYLKEFYGHCIHHPHGWGLAVLDGNEAVIEKEPVQATKSNYLKERLSLPVYAKTAFAHIRYATIGNVEYQNCHPHTLKDNNGRRWTLIHNGTIFDYAPLNKYVELQTGDTDSERILMYLVEKINEKERQEQRRLLPEERFALLDAIVSEMSKGNKLNLLLYDGELMYVHTNYADSLHFLERDGGVIFSTQSLNCHTCEKRADRSFLGGTGWQKVPFTTLLAYQEGKRVFEGTDHGNEYIDSEENLKFLYQIFSNL